MDVRGIALVSGYWFDLILSMERGERWPVAEWMQVALRLCDRGANTC
jgi:hypothetical protein